MDKVFHLLFVICVILTTGCEQRPVSQDPSDWDVPVNQVFDGGPGKDGIPSIDNPDFTTATEVDFMNDQELVLGIRIGDEIRAYPHPVLDWHEIVNDRIGAQALAITYCPLTGTGIAWDRALDGLETTFGVSGLLYNTNLMPYDRRTNSTWSQQRLDCVNGTLRGTRAVVYSLVETNWESWLKSFPDSKVLNLNTGVNRNYGAYPYGDYRTNDQRLLFPVVPLDNRLPWKERVLGILINGIPKVYRFDVSQSPVDILHDYVDGQDVVIARSTTHNFMVAFINPEGRTFMIAQDPLPAVLQDDSGNVYDLLGVVLSGAPDTKPLTLADQFIGYWFSWGAFYPGVEIFDE